jgi:hypothetical protein
VAKNLKESGKPSSSIAHIGSKTIFLLISLEKLYYSACEIYACIYSSCTLFGIYFYTSCIYFILQFPLVLLFHIFLSHFPLFLFSWNKVFWPNDICQYYNIVFSNRYAPPVGWCGDFPLWILGKKKELISRCEDNIWTTYYSLKMCQVPVQSGGGDWTIPPPDHQDRTMASPLDRISHENSS